MVVKCYFNDCGFCKYGLGCRFNHSEQVCRDSACLNRNCYRRHPRPCRNFFLRNYLNGNNCLTHSPFPYLISSFTLNILQIKPEYHSQPLKLSRIFVTDDFFIDIEIPFQSYP